MDIWLAVCRKRVKCSHCKEVIQLGEVMVVGKMWLTSKEEGEARRWVKNLRWHAQKGEAKVCCWREAGLDYLSTHPVAETRGRKQLQLSKAEKVARLKILRQHARLVQKLKFYMELPLNLQSEEDTAAMIKIGSQIMELKERIAKVGGVPKSWE